MSSIADMGMKDPIPQFSHLVNELKTRYPKLAYIHLVEPRVLASEDIEVKDGQSNDFIRKLWSPKLLLSAGGYNLENATQLVEENDNELVVFGRWFLSNVHFSCSFCQDVVLTLDVSARSQTSRRDSGRICPLISMTGARSTCTVTRQGKDTRTIHLSMQTRDLSNRLVLQDGIMDPIPNHQ